jgi:hypothetical protein
MQSGFMVPFTSWSVLTADFLILLHLTIGCITFSALLHLASAKWRYLVRDIAASLFSLYPVVAGLLVVLLLARHGVWLWMGESDHGHHPMNAWHHPAFLAAREIGALVLVGWLCRRFLRLQAVSERSEADWSRFKLTANFIPVMHVLYGTLVAWDFEMTMVPSWESSVYGMYHFVSNFGMFLAVLIVLIYRRQRAEAFVQPVPEFVLNYLAQMLLAFTILWTYLFFAQYLTIWYGNLPHERDRIEGMLLSYGPLWWTFFGMKFLVPFCLLVFTYVRHSPSSIYRIACVVVVGTWIERYTWLAGSRPVGAFEEPHWPFTAAFDVGVTVVLAWLAVWRVRQALIEKGIVHRPGVRTAAAPAA